MIQTVHLHLLLVYIVNCHNTAKQEIIQIALTTWNLKTVQTKQDLHLLDNNCNYKSSSQMCVCVCGLCSLQPTGVETWVSFSCIQFLFGYSCYLFPQTVDTLVLKGHMLGHLTVFLIMTDIIIYVYMSVATRGCYATINRLHPPQSQVYAWRFVN